MAFLVFERTNVSEGSGVLRPTGECFRLAGRNLIYQAWEKRCKPLDEGWHVSATELIRIHSSGLQTYDTRRLVIDFAPNSRRSIGLVELLDIYAYTWGYDTGEAVWTPLMLRLRDLYYKEFDHEITEQQKEEKIKQLPEPNDDSDLVEFLYLQGEQGGWNWGPNGMTNAAFLKGGARDYFRPFF